MIKRIYTCPKYKPPEDEKELYYSANQLTETMTRRRICEHCIGVKKEGTTLCKIFIDPQLADKELVRTILRKVGRHRKRMRYRMKTSSYNLLQDEQMEGKNE